MFIYIDIFNKQGYRLECVPVSGSTMFTMIPEVISNEAWASQCFKSNGGFYLYIPVQRKGIDVLISDSPAGPFTDPVNKAIINKNGIM